MSLLRSTQELNVKLFLAKNAGLFSDTHPCQKGLYASARVLLKDVTMDNEYES